MVGARGTLALTGATGFVGGHLLDLEERDGWQVRALTRRPQDERAGVEWVRGSLDDAASLTELTRGADAVMHVAGVVNAPDKAGFVAGNVTGTQAMVDAAKAAGVARFVHVSTLAASQPQLSDYGASKAEGERIVAASGLDWTIVRPPAIYGPGDTEMFELFRMARRGVVALPPDADGLLSVIHVGDFVRLLLALAVTQDDFTGAMFECDDGRESGWTQREVAKMIGDAVGRRVLALGTPKPVLRAGAALDRLLRGKGAKLTADRVSYFCHDDWRIDPAKRPPSHLWRPDIATAQGLAETAQWYREKGWM